MLDDGEMGWATVPHGQRRRRIMPRLKIIHTSTREQRVGLPVAHWFVEQAREHAKFEVVPSTSGPSTSRSSTSRSTR